MRIEPFKAGHAESIHEAYRGNKKLADKLEEGSDAFTGFAGDRIVACAGLIPCDTFRALAWVVFAFPFKRAEMLPVHRAISQYLDSHQPKPYRRIEMTTIADYEAGRRWARMLGFVYEGELRRYDEHGNTHLMYARIR